MMNETLTLENTHVCGDITTHPHAYTVEADGGLFRSFTIYSNVLPADDPDVFDEIEYYAIDLIDHYGGNHDAFTTDWVYEWFNGLELTDEEYQGAMDDRGGVLTAVITAPDGSEHTFELESEDL